MFFYVATENKQADIYIYIFQSSRRINHHEELSDWYLTTVAGFLVEDKGHKKAFDDIASE